MTDIMKLADDYAAKNRAVANVIEQGTSGELIEADGDKKRARAALKSAIEALQATQVKQSIQLAHDAATIECLNDKVMAMQAKLDALQAKNKRLDDEYGIVLRDSVKAVDKLSDVEAERDRLQSENERLKSENERDAFRLVWAMNWMRMDVHDYGFSKHVMERGGTGDYSDCATYIDAAMEASK